MEYGDGYTHGGSVSVGGINNERPLCIFNSAASIWEGGKVHPFTLCPETKTNGVFYSRWL